MRRLGFLIRKEFQELRRNPRMFPVIFIVMAFVGLYLLAVSMNEYIDPRSRLARVGGGTQ